MDWIHVALTVFGLLASGAGSILWYLYLSVRGDVKDAREVAEGIKDDLGKYKTHVAERYATQGDLSKSIDALNKTIESLARGIENMMNQVTAKLDKLDTRLERKADKP